MSKKVNKILWHGNERGSDGKAKAPNLASAGGDGTDGLNRGEVFINDADEDPAIFIRTDKDKVARIGGGDGASDSYTRAEVNALLNKKVDNAFFSRLFGLMGETGAEIAVNDVSSQGRDIKAKLGLWTEEYLSALGKNAEAGGTVAGVTELSKLSDVSLGTLVNGQALVYDSTTQKWVNRTIKTGLDEEALAAYLDANSYAKKNDIDNRINALVNGAPAAFDTLKEIADVLQGNVDSIGDILTTLGKKADKTVTITAGTGLTGGGDLSANRTLSLATVGTAGTYTKVTVDAYGRVTGHASLAAGDIPALSISKITGLQSALDKKLDAATFDDLFEKVEISTGVYAIRAKYGLYSDDWVSVMGANPDAGGTSSGVTELSELSDVSLGTLVNGQALVYDSTSQKWVNRTIESGLDTEELAAYLTENNYATQSWVTGQGYLKSVSLSTISDLHSSWDALLKAAPSAYVTRWPTAAEVGALTQATADGRYAYKGGSNASGTWPISISGNAATATNADTLDGYNSTSFDLVTNLSGVADYGMYVIGLLQITDYTTTGNHARGRLIFTRNNGNNPVCTIFYNFSTQYNSTNVRAGYLKLGYGSSGISLCTFTYNGKKWAGFTMTANSNYSNGVQVMRAGLRTCEYSTPFHVKYKTSNTGAIDNSEINNSLVINGSDIIENGVTTGTFVGALSGNAATASKWATARTITLTGAVTGSVSIDGSGNVSMATTYATGNISALDSRYVNVSGDTMTGGLTVPSLAVSGSTATVAGNKVWHAGNDGSGSGLDADLLDGVQGTGYGRAYSSNYAWDSTTGAITTATFVSKLQALGAFNTPYWMVKSTWYFAGNYYITDTGVGTIHLAGATIEVLGGTGNYMIRVLTGPTSANSGVTNAVFIYRNHGDGYSPNWKRIANTTDNVASATKLQTARTLWGQSFNGTANVSGALSGVTTISASGRITSAGLTCGYSNTSYNISTASFICQSWVRTTGATGWYNETYGGGWYMTDSTWIRTYNNKSVYQNTGQIRTDGYLVTNGGLTVGATSPNNGTYKVHCTGAMYASAGVVSDGYVSAKGANTSSDIRLKTKLSDIALSPKDIANAPSMLFAWKKNGMKDVGSSAQYWKNILPDAVKERDGWLEMAYGNIALVSAISLAKHVVSHEERIRQLENENRQLKEKIAMMERRIAWAA